MTTERERKRLRAIRKRRAALMKKLKANPRFEESKDSVKAVIIVGARPSVKT